MAKLLDVHSITKLNRYNKHIQDSRMLLRTMKIITKQVMIGRFNVFLQPSMLTPHTLEWLSKQNFAIAEQMGANKNKTRITFPTNDHGML